MRVQPLLQYGTYIDTLSSKIAAPNHKVKTVYSPKKVYKTGQMFNFSV